MDAQSAELIGDRVLGSERCGGGVILTTELAATMGRATYQFDPLARLEVVVLATPSFASMFNHLFTPSMAHAQIRQGSDPPITRSGFRSGFAVSVPEAYGPPGAPKPKAKLCDRPRAPLPLL